MIKNKKILAIIQARGGSKSIPKKNIYPISGSPLIAYTIYAAKNSSYIDDLIVSTDDVKIAEVAKNYGAKIPFMRPKSLARDTTTSADSLRHAVTNYEKITKIKYDYIIELPCVSPLRTSNDIDEAIRLIIKKKCDSVIGVCNTGEKHPVRLKRLSKKKQISGFCREYPEPLAGSRRQDLEPCFIRNGSIYLMKRDLIFFKKNRHGKNSLGYEMPQERSVNIDEKFDLTMVELLVKNGNCNNFPERLIPKYNKLNKDKINNKRILITYDLSNFEKLKKIFNQKEVLQVDKISKKDLIQVLKKVDGWLCFASPKYKIDDKILKNSNIKFISTPSTGTSHIDMNFCKKKKIKVLSLKENKKILKIKASSEYAFSMMLMTIKNIYNGASYVKMGYWREVENKLRSHEFAKKTVGILGFGRIGKNIAKFSRPLNFKTLFYDPHIKKSEFGCKKMNSLQEMLQLSDVVVVAVHLNAQTKGMVDKSFFKFVKKRSFFINISRGEIINETDLIQAIKSGAIERASVDVISNEQTRSIKLNKLYKFSKESDRLIITPHIAGLTYDSERKALTYAFKELKRYLKI
ncbi:MAG: cytidylyltransferase [Flavobacteriaceae bacterium]|nr:cytidylyltransferase [Flavobacteriaceae bacterium]